MASDQPIDRFTPEQLEALLFDNLMRRTTDLVYFKDLHSRFVRISDRHAQHFKLAKASEAIGRTDRDFYRQTTAEDARRDELQIIATAHPMIDKEEIEHWPDGSESWVSTSKMPLTDRDGNVIGTFGISRDITERKRIEAALRRSESRLRKALDQLQADLTRARVVQQAFLPTELPDVLGLRMAVRYKPYELIGGDYCSVAPSTDSRVGFFVADLMGHGVSAALFMALLKFISDQQLNRLDCPPDACLAAINETMLHRFRDTFASALCGSMERLPDSPAWQVDIAGAGHPEPVLFDRASGSCRAIEMAGNAALGITDAFDTTSVRLTMHPGDRLLLYTDGVIETRNKHGAMLGDEGLPPLIERAFDPDPERSLDNLIGLLDEYRGGGRADDDILLLALEVAP